MVKYFDLVTGKTPTRKQLELLLFMNPFGENLTLEQAAKEIGISVWAANVRMANFRNNCPDAYDRFKSLKHQLSDSSLDRAERETILFSYISSTDEGVGNILQGTIRKVF